MVFVGVIVTVGVTVGVIVGVKDGDGATNWTKNSKSHSGSPTLNLTNALLLVSCPKLPVESIV